MNGRSFALVLFFLVIGLAIFQLVSFAVEDPGGLLTNLLTIAIVIAAFYWLYKLFTGRGGTNRSSYAKAVKQSKRKYAKPNVTPLSKKASVDKKTKKASVGFLKRKRKQTHLTVIEGKKGKKKDRASF